MILTIRTSEAFRWDEARSFADGMARVRLGDKWGFIDKTGSLKILCDWDCAFDFYEGLAAVCRNGKWGYIDRTGAIAG